MSQEEDERILAELVSGGSGKAPKPAKKEKKEVVEESEKIEKKEKVEDVIFESPQDRFRKVIRDQGYNKGIENMTSVFFRGDTDNPSWLDSTLILSNIPAKNREMIITAYYGKTLSELGIKVEPGSKASNTMLMGGSKPNEPNKDTINPDDLDVSKMAEKEMTEMFKAEKFKATMAQIRAMRDEAEARTQALMSKNTPTQPQIYMRQVSRPIFKDGLLAKDATGNILYETVSEPVNPNIQSGSGGIGEMMPLLISMMQQNKAPQNTEMGEYFKRMDERIQSMERNNELRAKEDQIKRIEDEKLRKEEQYRRDIEQKDKEYKERLEKIEDNNRRDLQALETRFTETINHRKELDTIVGSISGEHKKEMDLIKQKLEHAQTSIERTVVAKGTDTVDKLTTSFADIAESVVKPMAEVMKDQYSLGIDQQRQALGLPPLKSTLPKVTDDELRSFVQ